MHNESHAKTWYKFDLLYAVLNVQTWTKFLRHFFRHPKECVSWFVIVLWFIMIFNNHLSVSVLNMAGIRRRVMHQWTISWRHIWLVKSLAAERMGILFWLQGQILNKICSAICYEKLFHMPLPQKPSYWVLMALITFGVIFHGDAIKPNMSFCPVFTPMRNWTTWFFNHHYQYRNVEYELVIALINKKIQNIISTLPCHRHQFQIW